MSKSNNIPVWTFGNNLVDSGVSISSIGSGSLSADTGLITTINSGDYTETISHSLGKIPKIINFNGIMIYTPTDRRLATSSGSYYNGNNKSIVGSIMSSANDGQASGESSTSYCVDMYIVSSAYYIHASVSDVSSSNYTLTYNNSFNDVQIQRFIHWTALA